MEQLQELAKELGYPGVEKLWRAAERRNLPLKRAQVAAFVQTQGQRQVFAPRPKYDGKIVATTINDRWAADLIDYTARPSKNKDSSEEPFQYILIVQDVFSRKISAEPLRSKTTEAVEPAFDRIVRSAGAPRELDTDNGLEFRGNFEKYLEIEQIEHDISDSRNKNARGALDAAIRTFKQQLSRIQVAENNRDWASLVPRAVAAYNDSVHSALIGRAPGDVKRDKDLQFTLKTIAADGLQKNEANIENRGNRLQKLGGFRNELAHQPRGFERSFKPKYGDEVHSVSKVIGGTVYSETGKAYPTRHVLAVPSATEDVNTEGMHGGSDQTDRLRLQILEPYKDRISNFLGILGKFEFEVVNYMKQIGMEPLMKQGLSYRKSLRLLGFTVHGNARGSGKHLVTRDAQAPAAPVPQAAPAPRSRPILPPAQAAAALAAPVRRRTMGKQPGK